MSRIRLRVSHRDAALVVAQGSTKRSYKPFAQCFGSTANRKAALVVKAVNCHSHMVKALQAVQRTAELPSNGDRARMRTRLALIVSYSKLALKRLET
jgi:hypothetical protein